MSQSVNSAKPKQPLKSSLAALVVAGFISGILICAGFWLFNAGFGTAGTLFATILIFLSVMALLVAFRIYAHISLNLAQNDQKHLQNALVQAKDMLDTSKQMREEQLLLQSLLQNLPFPVWLKDRFGRYLVTNQAFIQQWCDNKEPKGLTDVELLNAKLAETFAAADQQALDTNIPHKLDLRLDISGQSSQWVHIERYALQAEDGQAVGVLGFATDISTYKNAVVAESELLKDPVTGFLNQAGLNKYISQTELDGQKRHCVQIDIDHFKVLNDSLGHDSGDQLLRHVAERILLATQSGEVLARVSADEFLLFLKDNHEDDFQQRLNLLHEQLSLPVTINDTQYSFTTSIGVASSPEQGETLEALKHNAGVALFNAKKLGRNQIHWYHADYQDQALRRLNKEQLLRQAIGEQDLAIHVQPRIDCRTGAIEALECLVRIQLDEGDLMYPGNFISLAEKNGLIRKIDHFMLDSAFNQVNDWLNQGIEPLTLAVNLSLQSFNQQLLDHLSQWQVRNPEVCKYIELELTEHRLPDRDEDFLKLLAAIGEYDVRLALDDFGTGYANLSRLPEWPFQILKLDRSFIVDLPNNEKQQAVVKSVIDLCKTLNIQVVAEGVETEAELTLVDELGCHCIQGFVYARPKPLADAENWLIQKKLGAQ